MEEATKAWAAGFFDGLRPKIGNRLLGVELAWRKRMWQELEQPEKADPSQSVPVTGIIRPKLI